MKYTLLEVVQDVLNDLDADFVNGIDDTVESQQVAQIAKTCYNEMISNRDWPHLRQLSQLEASGDLAKPTHMRVPDAIKKLEWVKYDKMRETETRIRYEDVQYKYPDEFLKISNARNSDNSNVKQVVDFSGTTLLVFDNAAPTYWTSFDDEWLVFDSYNKLLDDTLKKVKTQIYIVRDPVWEGLDASIPDLPEEAFAAYVEEVKSTAFFTLKQMMNQKAEQKASRQNRWLARKAWKAKGGVRYDDYGRKGKV